MTIDDRISRYLDEHGLATQAVQVLPLTGDASDRRYYRVLLRGAASVVLAVHAGPIRYDELPFVRVAELMRRIPLPVPALLHHSDPLGIIGQEDLGDVTLQAHLGAAPPSAHAALYRDAVRFIATLQARGAELADDRYPPYGIAFDVEKLTWELDYFVKHFLGAYRGSAPDRATADALAVEWRTLAETLAAEPRVLCHRDYHSRNLMLHGGSLHIIDFQDARLGPDTYDLVSLLRDSYVDLSADQVDELLAYYLALRGADASAAGTFRERFDVMAVQRNLKALGTFGYQTTMRGNPVYIQYIPRTLRYLRANLEGYSRFGRLRDLLGGLIEELR
ncbi:MAG: aminoglycoside phosphotransferase family protein [Vicinamibacterales bacterium]